MSFSGFTFMMVTPLKASRASDDSDDDDDKDEDGDEDEDEDE